ncbi:MAG TPA: cation transporter [Ignavibacteriaceae bacterium]|nr:cation transporter [Ignavibacteriaceae bacterium]
MTTKEIKIEGMSCGHCEMAVRKQLSKLDNVKVKEVKIGKAVVEYDENKVSEELLYDAVEEAGYKPIK